MKKFQKLGVIFITTMLALTLFVACKQEEDDIGSSSAKWSYPTKTPTPTWEGSGTQLKPYIIKTAQQLADLAYMVNNGTSYSGNYFELANDLNLNPGKTLPQTLTDTNLLKWIPIGIDKNSGTGAFASTRCFSGTFDGKGHTIKGLYILQPSSSLIDSNMRYYVGLFGYVKDGNILNLVLGGGNIEAFSGGYASQTNYAGSLVGYLENSNVINCGNEDTHIQASMSDKYVCLGGLVGGMEKSSSSSSVACSIINSYVKTTKVWGVYSGSESYSYTGGIVGSMEGSSSVINCFNNTQKSSTGLAGTEGNHLGGIAGKATSNDTISWCYWNKNSTYSFACPIKIVGTGSPTILNCAGFASPAETISGGYTSGNLLKNLNDWVTYMKAETLKNGGSIDYIKSWTSPANPKLIF